MTDFSRMRELAALLRAPVPMVEAQNTSAFDGLKTIVEEAIDDLEHKLCEGGALETLLDKHGLTGLDSQKDKDGATMLERLDVRTKQYKKEVLGIMLEIELMLASDLKEGMTIEPWAKNMVADAGMKVRNSEFMNMSDTGDGYWVTKARAEKAIEALRAAGHKVKVGKEWTTVSMAGKPKQGMSFDYDDPEESGKVGIRFFGPVNLGEDLNEMADISKFNSGWLKSRDAKELVNAFKAGHATVEVKGQSFKAVKAMNVKALTAGMVVTANYNSSNQGMDIVEVLGFNDGTGDEDKVQYKSMKEMLADKKVSSLKDVEDARMVVKDLVDGDQGGWYYQYEGRFARGSGAEKLTFTLVEKV